MQRCVIYFLCVIYTACRKIIICIPYSCDFSILHADLQGVIITERLIIIFSHKPIVIKDINGLYLNHCRFCLQTKHVNYVRCMINTSSLSHLFNTKASILFLKKMNAFLLSTDIMQEIRH